MENNYFTCGTMISESSGNCISILTNYYDVAIRMHQKHAGHAEMHAEMIFILLLVLLLSQVVLIQWQKHRPYSYHLCTLIGIIIHKPLNERKWKKLQSGMDKEIFRVCLSDRFLDPPSPPPFINFVHDKISIYLVLFWVRLG